MDKETKNKIAKITSILKEIEVAEDTKKNIFPLLYKLRKLKEKYGVENWKLWFYENKDFGKFFGKIMQKIAKYIFGFRDKETGEYTKLPKEWREYCKERDKKENAKSLQD